MRTKVHRSKFYIDNEGWLGLRFADDDDRQFKSFSLDGLLTIGRITERRSIERAICVLLGVCSPVKFLMG